MPGTLCPRSKAPQQNWRGKISHVQLHSFCCYLTTVCKGYEDLFWLTACFLKMLPKPRNTNPKPAAASGHLSPPPIHQDHRSISWWHLKQKQRNHSRRSVWKKISPVPFFILDAWLWISIPNAGWFILPGSDWESVEGCLSYLVLEISQAVNSIWASLPPLMFSTIYNESFGRHLKPCKVLNH